MLLKKCTKCKSTKGETEYNYRNKLTGWRHRACKECHSLYRRKHYVLNKNKYIAKAKKWNGKQRKIVEDYLYDYLSRNGCVDCGECDILVLDFDHVRGKNMAVSLMMRNCYSLEKIKKEIEMCEVRCANCHRRKTSLEYGYWKVGRITK